MTNQQKITIAIYPNLRGFGYVCLEGPLEPIDYGVVTIRPIANQPILARIQKLITYFNPSLLVIPNYASRYSRHNKRVKKLIDRLVILAKENDVPLEQYTRERIRNVFEQFGATSKYEIALKIIEGVKELEPRKPTYRKAWMCEDYNMGIFDAYSLALTHHYLTE